MYSLGTFAAPSTWWHISRPTPENIFMMLYAEERLRCTSHASTIYCTGGMVQELMNGKLLLELVSFEGTIADAKRGSRMAHHA